MRTTTLRLDDELTEEIREHRRVLQQTVPETTMAAAMRHLIRLGLANARAEPVGKRKRANHTSVNPGPVAVPEGQTEIPLSATSKRSPPAPVPPVASPPPEPGEHPGRRQRRR